MSGRWFGVGGDGQDRSVRDVGESTVTSTIVVMLIGAVAMAVVSAREKSRLALTESRG